MIKNSFFCFVLISLIYVFTIPCYAQEIEKRIDTLLVKGKSLKKCGAYQLALENFKKVKILAEIANDKKSLLEINQEFGSFYFFIEGNSKKALQYYVNGAELARETKNLKKYAILTNKIGKCYLRLQQYDNAISKFQEALLVQQQNHFIMDQIYTFDTIAAIYYQIGDYYNADFFARKALTIAESICNYQRVAIITANLGIIYTKMHDDKLEEGIQFLKKSLQTRIENNMMLKPIIFRNIGTIYLKLKKTDSASHYFNKALQLANDTNDYYEIAMLDHSFGKFELEANNANTALKLIKKSYAYFENMQEPVDVSFHEDLAETYAALKLYDSAYYYTQKFIELKEKQNNVISEKSIKKFEDRFKTIKERKQILSLKKETIYKSTIIEKEKKYKRFQSFSFFILLIAIIGGMLITYLVKSEFNFQRQENLRFKAVLEAEQKERSRIAKDLHDSLGQTISLIKLRSSNIIPVNEKKIQYAELIEIIDGAYDELHDIAYNIMPDMLLQNGIVDAIKEIARKVEHISGIKITFKEFSPCSNILLSESQKISLYRVVQESLSNAIKHAEAQHIIIKLTTRGALIQLSIEDDGKGMDLNKLKNPTGMGWKNIYSRVALIAGKIHVQSSNDTGTKVIVNIVSKNKMA